MRHKSGRYYARIYLGGKERWKALGTDLLEVAKTKLRDLTAPMEAAVKAQAAEDRGRMNVGQCAEILLTRIRDGYGLRTNRRAIRRISPGTQKYRQETLNALWRTWPELHSMDVRRVTPRAVEEWAREFSKDYSATRYNATLDTLRALLRIAQDAGARADNPAERIGRMTVGQKTLVLPEREKFRSFVSALRKGGACFSRHCADMVEFLAYTGARKLEASHVTWADIDFGRERVHLRVTKGSRPRYVPMIPDAKALLLRLQSVRDDDAAGASVLSVRECQKSMDRAAKEVGMSRITHHDLRHLFATQCIESGVDIPTVSRWLGHLDGGALAMRTYGHLRDEHSALAAQRVSFDPQAAAKST